MDKPIRVLHITGSMDPASGGPCQGLRTSTPTLQAMGIQREVVCFDSPDSAYLGKDSFPIHALGDKPNGWYYSSKLLPWLRENIERFDAIVSNGLWLYHSSAVSGVIDRYRKNRDSSRPLKWFVMPHGMLDPYFQRAPDRKLKAIRNWIYWKLLEQKVVCKADGVFFTCETELLLARETFQPYKPQQEINVGYGIETPGPYTAEMQEAFLRKCPEVANKPYLLFLSRIHPKKGVDLLVRAYLELKKAGLSLPKLVVAGPGMEADFGQSVRQLVSREQAFQNDIFFPGMMTGDAKWGAFYGCEAFFLPSHQENFGIAVAEALACGKPVLISDQVNIWREIQTGEGGLVAANSLEGVRLLLQQWAKLTPTDKETMAKRAKATFEQNFSIGPAALRFKEAIATALNQDSKIANLS
ncbi:glycosyltransferase [Larkinella sp. VNQ87]|uniref:glycosyltransferase n=1 Tax=Larkinella sp. VNQ87 TaxID=3400921 RepID=UPI003C059766